ncbi:MAG TPA: RcpC/CpaB family pilus assembly protein [Actinomycetota bacterium]|nr:RcpC/CpaB family pilus assembly protein [Actinomycetota bacterium]
MDVPSARRIARPTWINTRTVLGMMLFAAAVVAGGRFLEAANTTTPAWTAARDLAPGDVVESEDLRIVDVNLPADVGTQYILGGTSLSGSIITRPVPAGALIPASAVTLEANSGPGRLFTVPVAPEHAVGGALRPGDLVDIFATASEGDGCTNLVAAEVEVVDVVAAGGLVLEEEALAGITIAIAPSEVGAIAHAIRTKEIDVARVTVPGTAAASTTVCEEDAR